MEQKREEEERRREEEEEEEKKGMETICVWIIMILYGKYGYYGFVWLWYGLLWILVCPISRVWLGIHPNPIFLQSWVGKTLVV